MDDEYGSELSFERLQFNFGAYLEDSVSIQTYPSYYDRLQNAIQTINIAEDTKLECETDDFQLDQYRRLPIQKQGDVIGPLEAGAAQASIAMHC